MSNIPQVSGKQVIKVLEKVGFTVSRQKGSHIRLVRIQDGIKQLVTVPNHKTIRKGTLFLGALRQYKDADLDGWATTAGINPERYKQFEAGAVEIPSSLEEINDWSTRWRLTRDEIIYLKISGGYDVSVYLGDFTADDLKIGIEAILEDQPRFPLLRFAWDLANMSIDRETAQKREIAVGIFNDLQAQRGKASLESFYSGEVIYPEQRRRVQIHIFPVIADYEQEIWKERHFTTEDVASGITVVREHEFLNPDWPRVPFQQEPQLRYLAVAGTGRVLEGRGLDEPFKTAELDSIHLDAIQRVHTLSSIPVVILEIFQTYDNFRQVLGDPDLTGIDIVESGPIGIVYEGGLRQFIHALELNERGQLDKLDTSAHVLRDSLDRRDHFTKLLEILEKARVYKA